MPMTVLAALALGAQLAGSPAGVEETTPRPMAGSVAPEYPRAAAAAGVEGKATFRVEVDASGRVTSVTVVEVPREGLGFEASIERAVSAWRFMPATKGGVPVAGTYEGSVELMPALEGEVVFPVSPDEVWAAARAVLSDLETQPDTLHESEHVLVTRPAPYRAGVMPAPVDMALASGVTIEEVQWHVAVSPRFTNARVALAGVAFLRRGSDTFVLYNEPHLGAWLTERLAERLGRRPLPLSSKPGLRSKQSPTSGPCANRPVEAASRDGDAGTAAPVVLSRVAPLYPRRLLERVKEGSVSLQATVTEHGTLENVQVVSPRNPPPDFVTASLAAASLWRFRPATLDGCAIRLEVTLQMKFVLR